MHAEEERHALERQNKVRLVVLLGLLALLPAGSSPRFPFSSLPQQPGRSRSTRDQSPAKEEKEQKEQGLPSKPNASEGKGATAERRPSVTGEKTTKFTSAVVELTDLLELALDMIR